MRQSIKGVTSSLTRHFGGGIVNPKKRFLTGKGYSKAMKEALKYTKQSDIKKAFKTAGLKTDKFATHNPIREKEFIKDLKEASKAGISKRDTFKRGLASFRKIQSNENIKLKRQEKRTFQKLSKGTKKDMLWGKKSETIELSQGALLAAEDSKQRDVDVHKINFGIPGYENWRKDSDLGRKIRALEDLRYRTEEAKKELQNLKWTEELVRQQSTKEHDQRSYLRKFGLIAINKAEKDTWKPKTLQGQEGRENATGTENDDNYESKTISSQFGRQKKSNTNKKESNKTQKSGGGSSNIASHGQSIDNITTLQREKNITNAPLSIVKGFKKILNKNRPETQTVPEEDQTSTDEKQYGFIESNSKNIHLDEPSTTDYDDEQNQDNTKNTKEEKDA